MLKEPRIIRWIYGDPSDDGHGKWGEFFWNTTLEDEDLVKINDNMGPVFGFVLFKRWDNNKKERCPVGYDEIFADYEENKLKAGIFRKLASLGFKFSSEFSNADYDLGKIKDLPDDEYVEDGDLYYEDYEEILLFVINYMVNKLGMKGFTLEKSDVDAFMYGGGYGLFY